MAKRPKKSGRRKPSGNKRNKPRLAFLCETHIAKSIRTAVAEAGCAISSLREYGLESNVLDHGAIKRKMEDEGRIILTWDRDFLDQVRFQICTHPGVLKLSLSSQQPSHVAPRLRALLGSRLHRYCKHAIVELRDEDLLVHRPGGGYDRIELPGQDSMDRP